MSAYLSRSATSPGHERRLNVRSPVIEIRRLSVVDLVGEIVEDCDIVAFFDQMVNEVPTDKSGAAPDEYLSHESMYSFGQFSHNITRKDRSGIQVAIS